ncbi:MAG: hypothetical protein ACRC5C_06200 [Bacilli bacterium]
MEKTIIIDGQAVGFKSNGSTALRYKAQFGCDFLADVYKLGLMKDIIERNDFSNADFETLYNLVWVLAKTHDKSIPEPIEWLDRFDTFPIFDILPEVLELIESSIKVSKKK